MYSESCWMPGMNILAGTSSQDGMFLRFLMLEGSITMTISRRFTLQRILPAIGLGALAAGLSKAENQPHMHTALGHLRAARKSLEEADQDKGGHRAKAIQLVDEAIHHVEEGIAYANHH
jgi:hypothetical protein